MLGPGMCVIRPEQHYTTVGMGTSASMEEILGHATSLHVCTSIQIESRTPYVNASLLHYMATVIVHYTHIQRPYRNIAQNAVKQSFHLHY